MHTLRLSFFIAALLLLPVLSFAHALSGGHGHFSGHCHHHSGGGGHASYRVHYYARPHYYSSRGSRSYGGGGTDGLKLAEPIKGAQEFTLGMGVASDMQLGDNYTAFTPAVTHLSYHYYTSGGFAVGISAGIQSIAGRDSCNCNVSKNDPFSFTANTFTLAADIKWLYLSTNHVQLYSGAALGVCYYIEQDHYADHTSATVTGFRPDGQLTLFGIRYGRSLGVFLEAGIGYKGLLSGGISYEIR